MLCKMLFIIFYFTNPFLCNTSAKNSANWTAGKSMVNSKKRILPLPYERLKY